MKAQRFLICAVLLTVAGSAVATLQPFRPQEMPQPLDQHVHLQKAAGHWEGELIFHTPDGEESSARASETITNLGEFWTTGRFECEWMGMPFEGVSTQGYDPQKGKFIGTWVDNMSTHLSIMEGDYDEDEGVLEMRWRAPDQMGNQDVPHRSEMRMSETAYTMTFFVGEDEMKSMEIRMKRKDKKTIEAGTK